MKSKKHILFCILNWGLGHASRCIPLIQYLIEQDTEVILASDGRALELLKKEFPDLRTLSLPAYDIQYPSGNMFWNMGWQLPKISKAIRLERKFIQNLLASERIDALISDNRFGCSHKSVPSVFITHQVQIKVGIPLLEQLVQALNRYWINQFDVCWIPDNEGKESLAGSLSTNKGLKNGRAIGILSRMKTYSKEKEQDLLIILSGPEPQRTYLEELVLKQLQQISFSALLVQGITNENQSVQLRDNIRKVSFLTTEQLNDAIMASELVVCRSGYSSVMDLVALQQKALLIPTPGQTEQEYLVEHLQANPLFIGQQQVDLDIAQGACALRGRDLEFRFPEREFYKKVLDEFLEGLESRV